MEPIRMGRGDLDWLNRTHYSRLLKARPGSLCPGCWQAPVSATGARHRRRPPPRPRQAGQQEAQALPCRPRDTQRMCAVSARRACFCSSPMRKRPPYSYSHAASWGSLFFPLMRPNSRKGSKAVQGTATPPGNLQGKSRGGKGGSVRPVRREEVQTLDHCDSSVAFPPSLGCFSGLHGLFLSTYLPPSLLPSSLPLSAVPGELLYPVRVGGEHTQRQEG